MATELVIPGCKLETLFSIDYMLTIPKLKIGKEFRLSKIVYGLGGRYQ